MVTIVTKKIGLAGGPTRDYTSIQAWEDACPANLVTVDQVWKGEGYNDGELLATAVTTISGTTTDATRYLWLSAAPGHSFNDNPAKATNRLAYVAANGVALRVTATYATVIDVLTPYTRVDSWQFQCSAANSSGVHLVAGANFAKIASCIVQSRDGPPLRLSTGSQTATNCLAIANSAVGRGLYLESAPAVYNCTVVRPSNITATGDAIYSVYGAATVKNCAFFGFTTLTGTFSADGHNITSSTVAPGTTGSLANKVYANQFVQSSTAGAVEDFRVKAGSDLIGAGVQDTANTSDLDILAQARSTSAPTVGAMEYVVAGGSSQPVHQTLTVANSTQSSTSSTAAITQHHRLNASNTSQSSSTSTAAIVERHKLAAAPSSQASTSSTVAITQRHKLAAANSTQSSASSTPAMGVLRHTLAVAPSSSSATSSAPAIVQHQQLTVASSSGSSASSTVSITQVLPPRYARPTADVANSGWAPSAGDSLAAMVAEPSADGSTFIQASAPATCRMQLNVVQRPAAGTQQVVRYQVWSATGNGITVRLVYAGTVLASWTHTQLPVDPTVFAQPLNAGQVAAITDWSALALEFEAF